MVFIAAQKTHSFDATCTLVGNGWGSGAGLAPKLVAASEAGSWGEGMLLLCDIQQLREVFCRVWFNVICLPSPPPMSNDR